MTSRRESQTPRQAARFAVALLASTFLGACAALPDDAPVVEQLDTETGATVARLGRPFELYRDGLIPGDAANRFAFIGPFETNQMGNREPFLWIAVPVEPAPGSVPTIEVDGKVLAVGTSGRAPDFAGIDKPPYKIPTPWSAMYYFKIDVATVAALGEAADISIRTLEPGKNGPIEALFAAKVAADSRFKEFAAR